MDLTDNPRLQRRMAEDSLQPLIPQVRVHKKIRLDTVKLHVLVKENKEWAQRKGRLLQLQIQALQVTECSYKSSISRKFIMAKPVK